MKPERIVELRKLIDAATPGPWIPKQTKTVALLSGISEHEVRAADGNAVAHIMFDEANVTRADNDLVYIAAARTALPEALDDIERLRKLLDIFAATHEHNVRLKRDLTTKADEIERLQDRLEEYRSEVERRDEMLADADKRAHEFAEFGVKSRLAEMTEAIEHYRAKLADARDALGECRQYVDRSARDEYDTSYELELLATIDRALGQGGAK